MSMLPAVLRGIRTKDRGGGAFLGYSGTLWRFAQKVVRDALEQGLSCLEACNSWHSGAYLLETVPCVLYILTIYGHDPEEAIVRAVNDTRDNDTAAAIVGAAVGALHGKSGIPSRWIAGLSGRTGADDDGAMFELLSRARERWWQSDSAADPSPANRSPRRPFQS